MTMLIVLEGERRSGKSTLATLLSRVMNAEVIHCTSKTPNTYSFFSEIIKASYQRNIICDRFCYGQFAYQDEDERNLDLRLLHKLELEMLSAGTSVIYVQCSPEEIERRILETGRDSANGVYFKSPKEVIKGFDEIFKISMLPIIKYDSQTGRVL